MGGDSGDYDRKRVGLKMRTRGGMKVKHGRASSKGDSKNQRQGGVVRQSPDGLASLKKRDSSVADTALIPAPLSWTSPLMKWNSGNKFESIR